MIQDNYSLLTITFVENLNVLIVGGYNGRQIYTSEIKAFENNGQNTGWPKSKFLISNGSTAGSNHIWSYVGKVKIGLRGGSFFLLSANFYIHFKYKGEKWQFSSSASMV